MKSKHTLAASASLAVALLCPGARAALLSATDIPATGSIAVQTAPQPPPPTVPTEDVERTRQELERTHHELQSRLAEAADAERASQEALAAAREVTLTLAMRDADDEEDMPEPPEPPEPPESPDIAAVFTPDNAGGASAVRILRTAELPTNVADEMREDLAIMLRLLDKASATRRAGSYGERAMGLDLFFVGQGSPSRAVYLDDYGAILTVNVNTALLPPADRIEAPTPPKPEEDSEWEQARREVTGQNAGNKGPFHVLRDIEVLGGGPRAVPYDEAKVSALQSAILEALKNASRIRHLKPEDRILVSITGPAPASAGDKAPQKGKEVRHVEIRKNNAPVAGGGSGVVIKHATAAPKGSTMNIRVTKADADAYAKGTIDLTEFKSRARIATYPGGARGMTIGF